GKNALGHDAAFAREVLHGLAKTAYSAEKVDKFESLRAEAIGADLHCVLFRKPGRRIQDKPGCGAKYWLFLEECDSIGFHKFISDGDCELESASIRVGHGI